MSVALMRGEWGERVALDHLCENGYDIVEQNFRSRYGEIDIVAQQGDTIVFIEVKTRAPHAMVTGIESISPSKQKKLRYTAEMYLTKFNNMPPARFDVIDIVANGWTVESIELIVDAF